MADYAIHDTTLIGTSNVIRKKEGSSALIDPADYPKRINLMGMLEVGGVLESDYCKIDNGSDDVPMLHAIVYLPASLDGYTGTSVIQTGKNLVDGTNFTRGLPSTTIGASIDTITTSTRYAYIGVSVGGTNFTISSVSNDTDYFWNILIFGYTNGILSVYTNTSVNASKTVDFSACDFIRLAIGTRSASYQVPTDLTEYGTIQLEFGSTASAYKEYVAPKTYSADFGRTIHGGREDLATGEGKGSYKKINLGDYTWIKSGNEGDFYCQQLTDIWYPSTGGISRYGDYICDKFNAVQSAPADGEINCYYNTAYNGYRISIKKADYADNTSAEFKAFLQEYNAHLVYRVNEATEEDFTFDAQDINTMLGDNVFYSEDGTMSIEYRSSGTMTPIVPTLISKNITANGTYTASDDGADGYDTVAVNVASQEPTVTPLNSPNAFMTISGITGTDVTRVARTITAPSDGKYVFASDSTCMTNTVSGDGFIDIQKNDVSVVKQYMSANTTTAITIPDIDVEAGDEVDIVVGFDNAHSSCNFQLCTGIALVSEASAPSLLSMMPSEEVNENEEVEEDEQNDVEG